MCTFDIKNHISTGKRLEWCVLLDRGEAKASAVRQVKDKAIARFGVGASKAKWGATLPASNGFCVVWMEP